MHSSAFGILLLMTHDFQRQRSVSYIGICLAKIFLGRAFGMGSESSCSLIPDLGFLYFVAYVVLSARCYPFLKSLIPIMEEKDEISLGV